ncbi:MAG: alkane 1-monooxygenase, partial [Flavobacteriales bacterium]|nr:alkane 1-monooxygenase [Flavobacteriales bacterium]
ALQEGGLWAYAVPFVAFGLIPVLELWLPFDRRNVPTELEEARQRLRVFDFLLYINIPFFWYLLHIYLNRMSRGDLPFWEMGGYVWTMSILCGVLGINVAHELGHHRRSVDQWLARLQLLGSLYMHFFIEHNRGHHRYVSTPLDPASAPIGMSVYKFWLRSVIGGIRSAWRLEVQRLRSRGLSPWNWRNEMLWYAAAQSALLGAVALRYGWAGLGAFLCAAVGGILLLETVNYIEHYGLQRREVRPGIYEPVQPRHSWNSEHLLGRILLYELTRHSDHHYKSSRKYQNLRYFEESPQLPLGYPASMWLSLVPPLWFSRMDRLAMRWRAVGGQG